VHEVALAALHPPLREDALRHAAVVVADGLRAHLPPLLLLLVLLDQRRVDRARRLPRIRRAVAPLDEVLGATAPPPLPDHALDVVVVRALLGLGRCLGIIPLPPLRRVDLRRLGYGCAQLPRAAA